MTSALLLLSAGLAIVLLVRKPARQVFGASPAFTLWLLPLLLACLPWLPTMPARWSLLPALIVLPDASTGAIAAASSGITGMRWLPWLWLAGCLCGLLRLFVHHRRLLRQCRPMPESMRQSVQSLLPGSRIRLHFCLHPAGPAVLWAPRCRLLLPPDFLDRFQPHEQRLILQHELAHLRRGDPLWLLLAELTAVALWFHPLAWLALPRLRLDQELACDECVLRGMPREETAYARVLMHSVASRPAPALIPWLAEPQLKERLTMIQRHRPGALRRRIGYLGLGLLMAGGTLVAQAGTQAADNQSAQSDMSYNSGRQPAYPEEAIKNGEQGTVILLVQVHADGSLGTIAYDREHSTTDFADLIAAASTAARQWRFEPQMKSGHAVDGYARVPIKFSLNQL